VGKHNTRPSRFHQSESSNARIDERNRLAAEIMVREGIAIDDQHALMLKHADCITATCTLPMRAIAVQAEQVARSVRAELEKK